MIEELLLYNFRNYKTLRLKPSEAINIFIGQNGQGKTNILEAIKVILSSEKLRSCEYRDLIFKKEESGSIISKIKNNQSFDEIKIIFRENKKTILINDKPSNGPQLKKKWSEVTFTPDSLNIIKSTPELRRQLIDELMFQTSNESLDRYQKFKKILLNRNKILKNFKEGKSTLNETNKLLRIIDPLFTEVSTQITEKRINTLNEFKPYFDVATQNIFNSESQVEIHYQASGKKLNQVDHNFIHNLIENRILELKSAELSIGHSLVGPQKHDIDFIFDNHNARSYCSQGQQRALILAFKMAQIVYHYRLRGYYPILLLDDVMSELDEYRTKEIFRFLIQLPTQIFITTTDLNLNLSESEIKKEIKIFKINHGSIVSERVIQCQI